MKFNLGSMAVCAVLAVGGAQAAAINIGGTIVYTQTTGESTPDRFTFNITNNTSAGQVAVSGLHVTAGGTGQNTVFFDRTPGAPGYGTSGSAAAGTVGNGFLISESFSADGVSPLTLDALFSGLLTSYTAYRDLDAKNGFNTSSNGECSNCGRVSAANWNAGGFGLALDLTTTTPTITLANVSRVTLSRPLLSTNEGALNSVTYNWSMTLDSAPVAGTNAGLPGSPVPEPGTYAMLGAGLSALALWRRRKA